MYKALTVALILTGWTLLPTPVLAADPETPGYIGVQIKVDGNTGEVTIEAVIGESPADKAGLKMGDVLVKVGDVDATDLKTVVKTIMETKPGEKITLKVKRDGKAEEIKVTVGKRPDMQEPRN